MKKILFATLAFLCLAMSATAQRYTVYVTNKVNIHNAPEGNWIIYRAHNEDDYSVLYSNQSKSACMLLSGEVACVNTPSMTPVNPPITSVLR